MTHRMIKAVALTAAVAMAALTLPTSEAEAHHRGRFVAAGIIGLAAGAIIGSALANRHYHGGRPHYHKHRRHYKPARYHRKRYRPRPWTRAWYDYCFSRYRTFNPRTGMYVGYDRRRHFCR